jgi:hypothetical protein
MEAKVKEGRPLKDFEADWVVKCSKVLSEADYTDAAIEALDKVPDDKMDGLYEELEGVDDFEL